MVLIKDYKVIGNNALVWDGKYFGVGRNPMLTKTWTFKDIYVFYVFSIAVDCFTYIEYNIRHVVYHN